MEACNCLSVDWLKMIGVIVPLASGLSSFLNQMVRSKMDAKQEVSPLLLQACALLNILAINGDKAVQLVKASKKGGK